jgi:hypothetical protein
MKRFHRSRTGSAIVAALLLVTLAAAPVLAASTTWKVYTFNTSGHALRSQTATVSSSGAVSFTFPKTSDAAYLMSSKAPTNAAGLVALANISGTATFANYPGCTSSTTSPTVGLYFETKAAGGFNPSDYWWSTTRLALTSPSNLSFSDAFGNGSTWTNYYGKAGNQTGSYIVDGTTYPSAADGFTAAMANISNWGVSFGGDCFYANGVGTPTGSAVFTLLP